MASTSARPRRIPEWHGHQEVILVGVRHPLADVFPADFGARRSMRPDRVSREVWIVNNLGLHARAAAKLVTLASSFVAEVSLLRNDREVNAKSIMGVMMLAASKGSSLHIMARGVDAEQAVEQLAELIAQRFGEDE